MKRLLIVDDNEINRKLARTMARKIGWETAEADSGSAALALLAAEDFAAVLLDISMPHMDGEAVCRAIRANPAWAGLRVVAYTAHVLEAEKQGFLAAGFDDVLTKPVTLQAFTALLPA